jgi:hypothetical protein
MIRLEREDLETPSKLAALAAARGITPAAFADRYRYLVEKDTFQPNS